MNLPFSDQQKICKKYAQLQKTVLQGLCMLMTKLEKLE